MMPNRFRSTPSVPHPRDCFKQYPSTFEAAVSYRIQFCCGYT